MKPKRKLPYIPWFVTDWLTDKGVCMLSAQARGVWFDWLNHMWLDDQCGYLTGTRELLAKLGRCDISVVDSVAEELVSTRTAIVTREAAHVTVLNRRMHRLFKSRESNALRKSRSRAKARSPDHVTQQILHPPNPPQNSLLEFAIANCSMNAATFDELRELADDDAALQAALEAVASTESQGQEVRNWPNYFRALLRTHASAPAGGVTLQSWLAKKQREAEAKSAREAEQAEWQAQAQSPDRKGVGPNYAPDVTTPEPEPTPAQARRRKVSEYMKTTEGAELKRKLLKKEIAPAQFERSITDWLAKQSTEDTENDNAHCE